MTDFNLTDAYNLSDAYAVAHNVTMPEPSVVYVYQNEIIISLLIIIAFCQIISLFFILSRNVAGGEKKQ